MSAVFAALIGAISGSFGGNIINDWLRRRNEREIQRKNIIDNYLLQLQDAIESLWFRLDSIKNNNARVSMQPIYYEETTLYVLGSVLAYKRILLLRGLYAQIEQLIPGLGKVLKDRLNYIESELGNSLTFPHSQFFRYDRLALAEAMIKNTEYGIGTCSYLEFKEKYESDNSLLKSSVKSALEFVEHLDSNLHRPGADRKMEQLRQISLRIKNETGIPSEIDAK